MSSTHTRPADAVPDSWVDRRLPERWRPWARLMRLDRPVGAWLLLWPCWWSYMLAQPSDRVPGYILEFCGHCKTDIVLDLALFGLGALVLRAAGCTINDLWDRHIDAKVARTAGRPIASGAVSVPGALVLLGILGLIGLLILSQFPTAMVVLAFLSVPLVVLYPLAKRVTYWPQVVLGIVFNWGALLGWTAVHASYISATFWTGWAPVVLYAGCFFWTLGYDTIYAHMDKIDDVTAGVKSSALALGSRTKPFLWGVYGMAIVLWGTAGHLAFLQWPFYVGLAFAALHFVRQIVRLDIDDPASCLATFRSNIRFGWIIFAAIVLGGFAIALYELLYRWVMY